MMIYLLKISKTLIQPQILSFVNVFYQFINQLIQLNLINMEQKPQHHITANGNYDIYLTFASNELQIILISNLSSEIYSLKISNASMLHQCKMIFQNSINLYDHLKQHAEGKSGFMVLDDVGCIKVYEEFQKNGKKIKMEVILNTNKIIKDNDKNVLLLKIINLMKKYYVKKEEQPKNKENKVVSVAKKVKIFKKECISISNTININDLYNKEHQVYSLTFNEKLQVKKQGNSNNLILRFNRIRQQRYQYITLKIIKSDTFQIQFGLIPNQATDYSMSIDFSTGSIRSTKNNSEKSMRTSWHNGGRAIKEFTQKIIKMEVDLEDNQITWLCNNTFIGKAVISQQLNKNLLQSFIYMKNAGDSVILNYE